MELIKNKIVFIVSFEVECGLIMVSDIVIDDIIFLFCIYSECDLVMIIQYCFSFVYINLKMFCMIYFKNVVMQDFFKLIDNKLCSLLLFYLLFFLFFIDYIL